MDLELSEEKESVSAETSPDKGFTLMFNSQRTNLTRVKKKNGLNRRFSQTSRQSRETIGSQSKERNIVS